MRMGDGPGKRIYSHVPFDPITHSLARSTLDGSRSRRYAGVHSPNAARDTSAAMDDVNQWLSKDRSQTPAPTYG